MQMIYKREKWIDGVKLFACVLVALGHSFQSMEATGYLSALNQLWCSLTGQSIIFIFLCSLCVVDICIKEVVLHPLLDGDGIC